MSGQKDKKTNGPKGVRAVSHSCDVFIVVCIFQFSVIKTWFAMQLTKTNILPYSQVVYADICHWLMIELLKWASSLTSARSQKYLQLLHLVSRQALTLSTATPLSSLHSQSSCRRRWPADSNGPSGFTNCPSGSPIWPHALVLKRYQCVPKWSQKVTKWSQWVHKW